MQVTDRRTFLATVALGAVAAPLAAEAEPAGKVWRIGYLAARSRSTPSNPDVYYDAFVQGMRELGYVEGDNLVIEWRFADGRFERLAALAAELVQTNVEVIATESTPAAQALQHATRQIPIVAVGVGDPVGSGLAASLSHPGGNITGLSNMVTDVAPKYVELLKTLMPKLSRVAVLMNSGTSLHARILQIVKTAAQKVGMDILPVDARTPEDIERGFATMTKEHAGAVIVLPDAFLVGQRRQLVELSAKNRLPSMFSFREDVEAGGLMSYGQDITDHQRRAATYVRKILNGAKPSELPFEQPTKLYLAINGNTAKALGLTIPQSLLLRADHVLE